MKDMSLPDQVVKHLLQKDASVKQAMQQMKVIGEKVLFVVSADNSLFGALSDGDIRKWILDEGSLEAPVERVCNQRPETVGEDFDMNVVKRLMLDLKIESVPVVNDDNVIVSVLVWDHVFRNGEVKPRGQISIPVVVMAGGKGTRLDPFTRVLPKPMIPIGDKTILEIIMDSFHDYHVSEFYLSVNHKSYIIKAYLQEMVDQYNIHYLEEHKPLGTAGSLRLLLETDWPQFVVTNCDIIIEADLAEIVSFHNDREFDMTLVVSYRHYKIPYGVCNIADGGLLDSITEKPEYDYLVNTGMYIVNRSILDLIPEDQVFDVPELIDLAKAKNLRVGIFPIDEKSWTDVGQWEEYRMAIKRLSLT